MLSGPSDPARERIVLSKGHACLAGTRRCTSAGIISDEELDTFCGEGSRLGTHPEHILPRHRLLDRLAGARPVDRDRLGARARVSAGEPRRTFVVMSDAECNEGSVWEAAMFAAHHRLSRLIAIVDVNGQQALGYTRDVLDLSPLKARWDAFGWDAQEVDGHDHRAMAASIDDFEAADERPHVLLARTMFGRGVSFMESEIRWHYCR